MKPYAVISNKRPIGIVPATTSVEALEAAAKRYHNVDSVLLIDGMGDLLDENLLSKDDLIAMLVATTGLDIQWSKLSKKDLYQLYVFFETNSHFNPRR